MAEPLSALTHLIPGLLLLLLGKAFVSRARGRPRVQGTLVVYALCVGGMFLTSGIYHALPYESEGRDLFWHLDHAGVWLALMGTFTGVMGVMTPFYPRYLAVYWIGTLVGISIELSLLRTLPPWISPSLYVVIGWAQVPLLIRVWQLHGKWPVSFMLLGGLLATIGGIMDATDQPVLVPGYVEAHELLHVLIVSGASCYFGLLWWAAPGIYLEPLPGTSGRGELA